MKIDIWEDVKRGGYYAKVDSYERVSFDEIPEKAVYRLVGMLGKLHQDASDAAAGAIQKFRGEK